MAVHDKAAKREVPYGQTSILLLNIVVVLAAAVVAYTDWRVLADVSLGYLYLLPIVLSGLVNPLPVTMSLAVLFDILQDAFGPPMESAGLRVARAGISLAGYLIAGFLVTRIARQRERLAGEVRKQRDDYERDLSLAAQVQRRVLSKPPKVPGFELAATMHPARVLGGDYYDFVQISDDVVDVVIADVSGKGAAASLLMPSLALALRSRARELSGPAAMLKDLDESLRQITNSAMFVTVVYARLSASARTLEYANGGHNPPLVVRAGTGECEPLESTGPIVGILPNAEFESRIVTLEPGDVVTLYTDGVTEQEDERGEEFGEARLRALIAEKARNAEETVDDIVSTVRSHAGTQEQGDDLTVVVVKVR